MRRSLAPRRGHGLAHDGSPFAPGLADVDARFTVLDPESFDPLPQGVDSRRVWLDAPAQVLVSWRGALDEAGNASVAVVARLSATVGRRDPLRGTHAGCYARDVRERAGGAAPGSSVRYGRFVLARRPRSRAR